MFDNFCSVIVPTEPPAAAVRENNQWQLCPRDRTIFHPGQADIGGRRKFPERYGLRLPCAWIPNSACQRRIGIEKLDTGRPRGRTQTTKYYGINPTCIAYQ